MTYNCKSYDHNTSETFDAANENTNLMQQS